MSKKMLINASHPEENRVAIVVDGILSELDIEIAGQEQSKGNIYKAVVVRVETGLQAAFVDYGAEKLGFLQIGEIHPSIYPPKEEKGGRPRIADILRRGQEILVQIVKEERGNKGAALTTYLSLPGRYMVLMPDSTTKGVSRKISDDAERKKLKRTMAELDLPEKMGYIVRTAGIGKDKEELKRDFDYLVRLYEGIVARQNQVKAPAQLYQESNLAIRTIRDYFTTEMDEVLIDGEQIYQDARDFFSLVMPEQVHLVKRHRERRPIFSRYQIEEQIDALAKNQISMASGGSIVIDQTEALVAIDVNSGKMASESGIEATALKTNLEAAAEVGRQLRLRDLGGLIVIDFIDMRDRKNIREVEVALRKALKDDKAKVSVGRISQFGLMEMSRQRLKPTLSVGAYISCPHCKGLGKIKSIEAQAVNLLRQVHTAASKTQIGRIEATVPVEVANYLLNQKRATILELEEQLNLTLEIGGRTDMLPGESELELHKREKEQDDQHRILPVSHANQIEVALAAQQEELSAETQHGEENEDEPDLLEAEETAAEEAPKKRRRRRRKKPQQTTTEAATEQAADNVEMSATEGDTESPDQATAATEEAQNKAEDSTVEDTQDQAPAGESEKPKRKRRRSSRRKSQTKDQVSSTEETTEQPLSADAAGEAGPPADTPRAEKAAESPGSADAAGQAQEQEPDATDATGTEEAKPKKRARRSRRRKTPAADAVTNDGAAAEAVSTAPEQAAYTTDIAPTERPKTESAVKTEGPEATTETVTVEPAADATAAAPNKRPRRSRKKPATPTTKAAEVAEVAEVAEQEAAPEPVEAKASETTTETAAPESTTETLEEKPKKTARRSTRKKPTATKVATTAEEQAAKPEATQIAQTETSEGEKAEQPAEEKPKRRTRRAPAKKKPAHDEPESANDTAVASQAEAPATASAEKSEPTATEAPAVETEGTKKAAPARRPRKTTAKKVASPPAAQTEPVKEGGEQPGEEKTAATAGPKRKPAARKTTTKKSVETQTVATTEEKQSEPAAADVSKEDAEEKKPPRRTRRTTKKQEPAPATDAAPAAEAVKKPAAKRRTTRARKPAAEKPATE
ncbi:MAG: ribonuclease E [Desulfuromonas sp.]|nr:MAG: ribonuclease E [Desulfuromonas sp.]